jgi:hypothetical protein
MIAAGLISTVAFAGSLSAKPALKDVAHVRDGIIAAGIAYEISEQCGSLRARLFRGLTYLNGLKGHARSLGYTHDEIDAYINDNTEKNRLEGIAREQLAALGAVVGLEETYCTVGRAQIARGNAIGYLLR